MLYADWKTVTIDMLLLLLSMVCGSIIGYDREAHGKAAGLRTHALVCIGATLITIVSMRGFGSWEGGMRDPVRIVGQVVAGIGFLCAGTIIRDGLTIKGLTTAASLWVTCMIGIVVGAGLLQYAAIGTLVIFVVLGQFNRIEARIAVRSSSTLRVVASDRPGLLGDIASAFGRHMISISKSEISSDVDTGLVSIELELRKTSKEGSVSIAAAELRTIRGVRDYEVHE